MRDLLPALALSAVLGALAAAVVGRRRRPEGLASLA
jgi:hypothetical protein